MKILLIDDDNASMRYYVQELEEEENNFKVKHVRDTDSALVAIAGEGKSFDLIILDSAMSPGKAYAAMQTDAGTSTGKFLFDYIRKAFPKTPILILTNFIGLDWIGEACRQPNVCAERKLDTLPSELVEKVNEMARKQ
jgi:CheY-like chemotaxis protein